MLPLLGLFAPRTLKRQGQWEHTFSVNPTIVGHVSTLTLAGAGGLASVVYEI